MAPALCGPACSSTAVHKQKGEQKGFLGGFHNVHSPLAAQENAVANGQLRQLPAGKQTSNNGGPCTASFT